MATERQFEVGNQHRMGTRAETVRTGSIWRGQLDYAQAVFAIGNVSELAWVGGAQLHIVSVVDPSIGIVNLVYPHILRVLNIEDGQPSVPCSGIHVCARSVQRFDSREWHTGNGLGMGRIR